MDSITHNVPDRNEIGVRELLQEILRYKWRVVGVVLTAMAVAVLIAFLSTPLYKATIVISPVASAPGSGSLGGVGNALSQLGGIASLAGLGVSGDSRKNESLAVLKSEELTDQYIKQNDLLPVLFERDWDATHKRWTETRPEKIPTLWKANRLFAHSIRTIAVEPKGGVVSLTITWEDPHAAAKWANGLVKMANDYLKNQALVESARNIAYLNEQAAKTDVVPVRQGIYSILQSEINKEMLARSSDEYAFKILDPAVAPEKPSSPQPVIWAFGALLASVMVCVFVLYARMAWFQD
jgi:uncharacterized protein involved in exopolysaccharide biosynthesis